MSTFDATDYFSSGPHEFTLGPAGSQWALQTDLGIAAPGLTVLGAHTLVVTVRGIVAAPTAASCEALIAELEARTGDKGALTDDQGRSWSALTMLDLRRDGPIQTGRVALQAYTATFAAVA